MMSRSSKLHTPNELRTGEFMDLPGKLVCLYYARTERKGSNT
jgi:hypothetical protein